MTVPARPAHAGIVNVQSLLSKEAPEGASGSLTGSVDWRTGNTELLLLSASALGRYRAGDNLFIAIVRGEFGKSKDERIISKSFEHLRFRRKLTDIVIVEAFGQHEYDQFRRLELRALVGAGPKFDFYTSDKFSIALGVAYMLEYERLRDDEEADAGDTDLQHRASSYLMGRVTLKDDVDFIETFYVQPRLTDPSDVRLLSETQMVIQITEKVSVTTAFSLSFDTETPDAIEELDTALKSSLTISFGDK